MVLVMTPRAAEQVAPAEAAAAPRPLPFKGTSVLAPRRISSVSIPGRMLSPQAAAHPETLLCCPGLLLNPHARLLVLSLGRRDRVPLAALAAFGHRDPPNPTDAKNTIPELSQYRQCLLSEHLMLHKGW